MRNIALTLKYLGTAYHGWQVQKNAATVCETLQKAIEKITGAPLKAEAKTYVADKLAALQQELYKDFFGEPGSHLAHEVLHTHYRERSRF